MRRCTARWMALSRASRTWPVAVLITPAPTTVTPPAPASSTPYPVATSPGSTPMTLRMRRSANGLGGGDGVDDLVGDVVVGEDGLDVVLLLERLDQPQHCRGILAVDAHGGLGHHVDLSLEHRNARPLQHLADCFHLVRRRGDLERIVHLLHVRGAGVERLLEELVLLDPHGIGVDQPATLEHPRDAARRPHVPAVLLEDV